MCYALMNSRLPRLSVGNSFKRQGDDDFVLEMRSALMRMVGLMPSIGHRFRRQEVKGLCLRNAVCAHDGK